jgi:GTP-binding protein EngB required for normal cell division
MEPANDRRYANRVPKHRVLLVFGPSQFGKSTFINNLLDLTNSNYQRAGVGTGIGESVTISTTLYQIGNLPFMFPEDIAGFDTLSIIDVPGLFDSGLRVSTEEIFNFIRTVLLDKGIKTLDAILVFEAMNDNSRKILHTLQYASDLFGNEVMRSAVVLTTKWDKVNKKGIPNTEKYLAQLIDGFNVAMMKWQNNVEDEITLKSLEMEAQISKLGSIICSIKPYYVSEMNELIERRDMIAEEIRMNDPERFIISELIVPVEILEEYMEDEEIETTEWINLTKEEIDTKLGLLANRKNLKMKVMNRHPELIKTSRIIETGMWWWTKRYEIPEFSIQFKEVEEEVDYYPHEVFESYRRQLEVQKNPIKVKKIIQQKRSRTIPGTKVVTNKIERHQFDFYQRLAAEELRRQFLAVARKPSKQ